MIVGSSKGIKIFGVLVILLAILFALAILLGEPSRPVSVFERYALWGIVTLLMFMGVGILKRLNLARLIFIVFSILLSYGTISVLIQRISQGKLHFAEVILTVCFLAFAFSGLWYFTRPSVKAQFKGSHVSIAQLILQYLIASFVVLLLSSPIGLLLNILLYPIYLYFFGQEILLSHLSSGLICLVFIWTVFYFSAYFLLKGSKKFYMDINSIRKIHKRAAIGTAIFIFVYGMFGSVSTSKEVFSYSCIVMSLLIIAVVMDRGLFDRLLNHGIQRVPE